MVEEIGEREGWAVCCCCCCCWGLVCGWRRGEGWLVLWAGVGVGGGGQMSVVPSREVGVVERGVGVCVWVEDEAEAEGSVEVEVD